MDLHEEDLFTRVQWSRKADTNLVAALLSIPQAAGALGRHLRAKYEMNLAAFGAGALSVLVSSGGGLRQREAARNLLLRFYPEECEFDGGEDSLGKMERLLSSCLRELTSKMAEFATSNEAAHLMHTLRAEMPEAQAVTLRLCLPSALVDAPPLQR